VIPKITVGTPDLPTIPTLKHGGIVPGRPGTPQLVMAHGGEQYLGVGGSRRSGGLVINVVNHLHGDVLGLEDVETFIQVTIRDAIRRGGFDRVIQARPA
jgi:hypothetical protein